MNKFIENLQKGQVVFFESHERPGKMASGVIQDINVTRIGPVRGHSSVRKELILTESQQSECFTRRNADVVFPDETSCNFYLMRLGAYKEEITNVKSLLNFMFTHTSTSDVAVYEAALQRAHELLGYTKEELLAQMRY